MQEFLLSPQTEWENKVNIAQTSGHIVKTVHLLSIHLKSKVTRMVKKSENWCLWTLWRWTLLLGVSQLSPLPLHSEEQEAEDSEEIGLCLSTGTGTVGFLIGTLPRMVSGIVLKLRGTLLIFTSTSTSFSATFITCIEKRTEISGHTVSSGQKRTNPIRQNHQRLLISKKFTSLPL